MKLRKIKVTLSLFIFGLTMILAASQSQAESALKQLKDAAKSYNHAVSVFDGSRLKK